MTSFLDTNVVLRYLVGDIPEQADRAAEIIDGESPLQVTDVVLHECAYVLTSSYRMPRRAVVDQLSEFLLKDNIIIFSMNKALVIQGLEMCRLSSRVSFGDALLWAAARSARAEAVYSFDQRFPADGLEVRRMRPQ